jgi:beta-galactosidase
MFTLFSFDGKDEKSLSGSGHIGDEKLYYGAAYYPEAWDFATVDEDIRYMKAVHMNVMRMGEFSWSLMEPKEGKYDFGWLHNVIDKLHQNGISVVLGTPTATPPAWMAEKYPEIFRITEDGTRLGHGSRRNCSYTSEVYRAFSRKICEAMAQEFGRKPGVIAWQTDNEFHASPDYSEHSKNLFHAWLEKKYKSIENLNQIWRTNLWSQHYDNFGQIPLPTDRIWHHPSLRMEWGRFNNEQVVEYQNIHVEAIRKYSDLPITHDGMPGQTLNYPDLFKDLDFMTTNVYHSFQVYDRVQSNYDRLMGYGKGMHWLFETAPNYSGGGSRGQTWFIHQPEGAMRAALWMNYALGGQGALFWLWRQHPAGQEMPHGSIISSWGKPAANYQQLVELGAELTALSEDFMHTPVAATRAAILYSHENDMGFRIEEYSGGISYYKDWAERFYTPMSDAFIHRDVIHEGVDLSRYDLVLAPLMPMIRPELRDRLKKWVEKGGILILGPMSGYRSEFWTAYTDHALGDLEPWMGMGVESRIPVDKFNAKDAQQTEVEFDASIAVGKANARLWSEALYTDKGTVLARYSHGMHHGLPAIVENKVKRGKVVLLGTDPGQEAIRAIISRYADEAGIEPLAEGDPGVLVVPRKGTDREFVAVVNLENDRRTIRLNTGEWRNMMDKNVELPAQIELEPYEVVFCEPLNAQTRNR